MKPILIPKGEFRNLYGKRKLTTYEIADIYNCCQATAWKRLKEYGIKCFPSGRRFLNIPQSRLKNLYINQRLSSRKIAKLYRCTYSAIDNKIKKYGFLKRNLAEAHIIYPRRSFNGNLTDKAYLIGFAIGDLRARKRSLSSETINVDCGSTKQEQIDLIVRLFKPYGRVWISKPNKKSCIQIECFLNNSFDFLLKKRNKIDRWILNNKRYFGAFLAGFTDAEGCISITNRGLAFYSLGNYNKVVLNQIYNKFLQLGIECRPPFISCKKGYVKKGGYVHRGDYWILSIIRKKFLLKLFRMLNPYLKHRKRVNDLKRARENIRLRNIKFGNLRMS